MTNLGCAVDLDGRDVNGKEDKRDTSVVLFHLIANIQIILGNY